jgi:hypothetical protein
MENTIRFEENAPCPVDITGTGGGLSFSPAGDMLLIGTFPSPSPTQIKAWEGKWRAKLLIESEFPAIPIFAIGSEEWILETPCNPQQQEKEAPGFCEALFSKEEHELVAVLVDSDTGIVKKIKRVNLEELFIERLVMSWNPFRGPSDQYNTSFTEEAFTSRIVDIFKTKSQREIWTTSW